MGLFKKALSAGVAKKAIDMARRPENQAKVRSMIAKRRRRGGPPTAR